MRAAASSHPVQKNGGTAAQTRLPVARRTSTTPQPKPRVKVPHQAVADSSSVARHAYRRSEHGVGHPVAIASTRETAEISNQKATAQRRGESAIWRKRAHSREQAPNIEDAAQGGNGPASGKATPAGRREKRPGPHFQAPNFQDACFITPPSLSHLHLVAAHGPWLSFIEAHNEQNCRSTAGRNSTFL